MSSSESNDNNSNNNNEQLDNKAILTSPDPNGQSQSDLNYQLVNRHVKDRMLRYRDAGNSRNAKEVLFQETLSFIRQNGFYFLSKGGQRLDAVATKGRVTSYYRKAFDKFERAEARAMAEEAKDEEEGKDDDEEAAEAAAASAPVSFETSDKNDNPTDSTGNTATEPARVDDAGHAEDTEGQQQPNQQQQLLQPSSLSSSSSSIVANIATNASSEGRRRRISSNDNNNKDPVAASTPSNCNPTERPDGILRQPNQREQQSLVSTLSSNSGANNNDNTATAASENHPSHDDLSVAAASTTGTKTRIEQRSSSFSTLLQQHEREGVEAIVPEAQEQQQLQPPCSSSLSSVAAVSSRMNPTVADDDIDNNRSVGSEAANTATGTENGKRDDDSPALVHNGEVHSQDEDYGFDDDNGGGFYDDDDDDHDGDNNNTAALRNQNSDDDSYVTVTEKQTSEQRPTSSIDPAVSIVDTSFITGANPPRHPKIPDKERSGMNTTATNEANTNEDDDKFRAGLDVSRIDHDDSSDAAPDTPTGGGEKPITKKNGDNYDAVDPLNDTLPTVVSNTTNTVGGENTITNSNDDTNPDSANLPKLLLLMVGIVVLLVNLCIQKFVAFEDCLVVFVFSFLTVCFMLQRSADRQQQEQEENSGNTNNGNEILQVANSTSDTKEDFIVPMLNDLAIHATALINATDDPRATFSKFHNQINEGVRD